MAKNANAQEHLVDTALDLFYRDGFHATGISAILSHAGVSRMTLYNHFGSKEELILAALRKRDENWRDWFEQAVLSSAATPRDRLLAIPEVIDSWIKSPKFFGCMFINASAEFSDPEDPVHVAAAEHKQSVFDFLKHLTIEAGAKAEDLIARQILLVMEGMIVDAQVLSRDASCQAAKDTVALIVDAGLGKAA